MIGPRRAGQVRENYASSCAPATGKYVLVSTTVPHNSPAPGTASAAA